MLGSKIWEDNFEVLLIEFILEVRKQKLYGDDSYPGQVQCQPSAGDQGPVAGVGVGLVSRVSAGVKCVCNVCGSAHSCGCVVN